MENHSLPISQSIAHHLEQMILDGTLKPNHKIPSERKLCTKLGVSRSIIREALRELQGRGLIVTRHGQGSYVAEMVQEPEDESPLMQLLFGHTRTLYDLFEVRETLDGQAAFLAAQRGTDEDFYQITKAFNAMEDATPETRAHYDYVFHHSIVEASHNPILVHMLSSLKKLMRHTVHASVVNLNHREKFKQQIDKHHRQIYNAVIGRQEQWAKKAAMAHVRHVCQSLKEIEKQEQNIIRTAIEAAPISETDLVS